MKKSLGILFLIGSLLPVTAQTEKKIIILHTNDLHSRILGYAPESAYTPLTVNDDKTVGGFARIASIFKTEKENSKGTTLVLDAGDFFMGTLFPSLEKETGFQLRLMKTMGYDAICLGNHEFEFGPEWLADVIRKSSERGSIPPIICGNAVFSKKDARDDGLEKLVADNVLTKKLVFTRDGIRFGIFSLLGKDAVSVAPKSAPVTFTKQVAFARRMVNELKKENCDIIICLSHSGVAKDKNGVWGGEDVDLARAVAGISVIISGHTHTRLEQPIMVNGIPIVQTGEFGQNVGCLSLTLSGGKLKVDGYKLIPVDDRISGDQDINNLINAQITKISEEVLKPLGMDYTKAVAESGFVVEGNDLGNYIDSNLGPLVADAIQYNVNSVGGKGTDISMVAAGVLFDKIPAGKQSAPDLFRVVPLGSGKDNIPGYALSRVYVTGKELKSILEILQVASGSTPEDYCYYSGLRVEFDPERGLFKKIRKIELINSDGNASIIDFSKKNKKLYSVTANSYMLEFIGIIKKKSFGLINVTPKDNSGNKIKNMESAVIDMNEKKDGIQEGKEWLSLIKFLSSMKDSNGDGIPDIDNKYAAPVRCFYKVSSK